MDWQFIPTALKATNAHYFSLHFTDDSQLSSENLSQQKRRPQAATAGRSRNLSIASNDMEDDQSTVS